MISGPAVIRIYFALQYTLCLYCKINNIVTVKGQSGRRGRNSRSIPFGPYWASITHPQNLCFSICTEIRDEEGKEKEHAEARETRDVGRFISAN